MCFRTIAVIEETTNYIYAFSRRFYPKRLTVHSGYICIVSMCFLGIKPTTFALLTQCSTTEPQEHVPHLTPPSLSQRIYAEFTTEIEVLPQSIFSFSFFKLNRHTVYTQLICMYIYIYIYIWEVYLPKRITVYIFKNYILLCYDVFIVF